MQLLKVKPSILVRMLQLLVQGTKRFANKRMASITLDICCEFSNQIHQCFNFTIKKRILSFIYLYPSLSQYLQNSHAKTLNRTMLEERPAFIEIA